jgi:hypothetical protein
MYDPHQNKYQAGEKSSAFDPACRGADLDGSSISSLGHNQKEARSGRHVVRVHRTIVFGVYARMPTSSAADQNQSITKSQGTGFRSNTDRRDAGNQQYIIRPCT